MVGIAEAAQLGTFLKAASDITKSAVGLSNAEAIRSKVIELQGVILSAQSSAMAAQSDQFALVERVRQLEGQIANLKTWEAKKHRYELYQWELGSFSYRLKDGVEPSEPTHHLCTNCYEQGCASILQTGAATMYNRSLRCNRCDASIATEKVTLSGSVYSGRVTRV